MKKTRIEETVPHSTEHVAADLSTPGQLRVSYGQTINRGNYEAERVEISVTMPIPGGMAMIDVMQKEEKLYRVIKARVETHTGKSFD